jgi:hypothetical protein
MHGSECDDVAAKYIARLRALNDLDISFSLVTDEGMAMIASLRDVRRLNIIATAVSDDGLRMVARMIALEELYLGPTNSVQRIEPYVTSAGLNYLIEARTMRHLGLWGDSFTDEAIPFLVQLGVEKLELIETELSGPGIQLVCNRLVNTRVEVRQ